MTVSRSLPLALLLAAAGTLGSAGLAGAAPAPKAAAPKAAAPSGPAIISLTLGRPTVGPGGGAVTVRLHVSEATTCWFAAPAAVKVSRAHRGCKNGYVATAVHLGAADTTRSLAYRLTASVAGLGGRTVRRVVVVRQAGLQPLSVSSLSLSATVGVGFTGQLAARGGRPPYTMAVVAGSLPAGISLSPGGALSGTPTTAGTTSATVKVTDDAKPVALSSELAVAFTVSPPPVTIATGSLAAASQGVFYSQRLSASGGTAPYSWSVAAGAPPAGLTLAANGTLSGVPSSAGTSTFTVRATDSSNPALSATGQLTVAVTSTPLVVPVTTILGATQGVSYSSTLPATGGTAPYTWTIVSGALPPGLALLPGGLVEGTPTASGTYQVILNVTDASSPVQAATSYVTIQVSSGALAITTPVTLSPPATHNQYYSFVFTASGGTAPYTWQVVGGTVPTGMTLSTTGLLSGTPTTPGAYSFTVEVFDSAYPQHTATETVSLTVV